MVMMIVVVDEDGDGDDDGCGIGGCACDFYSYESPPSYNCPAVFVSNTVPRAMEMITGS